MERGDLSGEEDRGPDRLHLRGVAAVRGPRARGTLRKLGDAGCHPAGDSLRRVRRIPRAAAARLRQQRLHADRAHHAGWARREERHPDRRVREVEARAGDTDRTGCVAGRRAPAPADPDDLFRFHPGYRSARDCARRRGGCAAGDGHRGRVRNARRHLGRRVLHSGVLRAAAADERAELAVPARDAAPDVHARGNRPSLQAATRLRAILRRLRTGTTSSHAEISNERFELPELAIVLLVAVLLSACMVGPDYRRPEVDIPANWRISDLQRCRDRQYCLVGSIPGCGAIGSRTNRTREQQGPRNRHGQCGSGRRAIRHRAFGAVSGSRTPAPRRRATA